MDIMIDLETMGTANDSAIIAIGAVVFSARGLGDEFYQQISLEDNFQCGRKASASTILWWLKQSDEARAAFDDNERASLLKCALTNLRAFIQLESGASFPTDCIVHIWGNGPEFDCGMLADAYRDVLHAEPPWHFAGTRCLRTLRDLAPDVPRPEFGGVKHNALADAENQALHAVQIMQHLGVWEKPE